MKKRLKGGIVVSGGGAVLADVVLDGEKVAAVGLPEEMELLAGADAEVVDVSGCLLFPGFIDAHTHFDLHVAGTVTADDFYTGTKAAIGGGTTTIVDFGTQYPGETLAQGLANWHEKADGKCSCDYGFHMSITEWNPEISREVQDMMDEGITSFKLYMTYDTMVDDETMYQILARLKELGAIAGVHCENHGIIQARLKEVEKEKGNRRDVSDYPWTRPEEAEAEAVSRLLKIAKCVDTPVIVVHLSTAAGYREILRAREDGQTVYVETCPQYLLMDEEKYSLPPEEARHYMIAPPLRKKKDRESLWRALGEGRIQTIATDHCSFTKEQKTAGAEDFAKTPCGMPGAEERPALIWQFGVNEERITAEQMCIYLSENPAKLYHLYPWKGALIPGADADIVVWNPDTEWTLSASDQQSACDYCPMEGTGIRGRAEQVYLRGTLAAENGKILVEKAGTYVRHGAE